MQILAAINMTQETLDRLRAAKAAAAVEAAARANAARGWRRAAGGMLGMMRMRLMGAEAGREREAAERAAREAAERAAREAAERAAREAAERGAARAKRQLTLSSLVRGLASWRQPAEATEVRPVQGAVSVLEAARGFEGVQPVPSAPVDCFWGGGGARVILILHECGWPTRTRAYGFGLAVPRLSHSVTISVHPPLTLAVYFCWQVALACRHPSTSAYEHLNSFARATHLLIPREPPIFSCTHVSAPCTAGPVAPPPTRHRGRSEG